MNLKIQKIDVVALNGAHIADAVYEALKLSVNEKRNVMLHHNNNKVFINFNEIIDFIQDKHN